MEKHNREKETLRELQVRLDFITYYFWWEKYFCVLLFYDLVILFQAELCDMRDQMDNLHAQHLKDTDEIDQLALLYKVSRIYTQHYCDYCNYCILLQ